MVDVDKSRIECRMYLQGEATKMYSMTDSLGSVSTSVEEGEAAGTAADVEKDL